ncbi:hypothetical protein NSMM_350046 [Nitrosomonas mobilis]|uniref:Uncharacterized protein n=1 Tax=Nitrosomonas mobilis TaxID=51642 RepID=A0A1G5SDG8_9PROT|nr:hypothetical protein NSMM_350046 [Nitrosomonas mobilis]
MSRYQEKYEEKMTSWFQGIEASWTREWYFIDIDRGIVMLLHLILQAKEGRGL